MRSSGFTKFQNKIFKLGLSPAEIAVYAAIISHDGENSRGIYPSRERIAELIGSSVSSVGRALSRLKTCSVIEWDRGRFARANTYRLLPFGVWKPLPSGQIDPKHYGSDRPVHRVSLTCTTGQADLPTRPMNQTHEPESANAPMLKAEAKRALDAIFANLGGRKKNESPEA